MSSFQSNEEESPAKFIITRGEAFMKTLVLSGGGARGAAHIGVIRALEERGFRPDAIVGVSIGALVGAGYAALGEWKPLWEGAREFYKKANKFFPFKSVPGLRSSVAILAGCLYMNFFKAFLPSRIYFSIVERAFKDIRFETLKIPLHVVVFNITEGKTGVFNSGSLARALKASMSIPGIFTPVRCGKGMYVDGGVVNNLPCNIAREIGAEYVLAVDVSERGAYPNVCSSSDLLKTMGLIQSKILIEEQGRKADLLITPPVSGVHTLDFSRSLKLIEEAYQYTSELLKRVSFPSGGGK